MIVSQKKKVFEKFYSKSTFFGIAHMLLNPSEFFKIYEKVIFLFNTRSYGRMHFLSTFSYFYLGIEASYQNITRDLFCVKKIKKYEKTILG